MLHKKALQKKLISLIVILMSGALLFVFVGNLGAEINDAADRDICQKSVLARAAEKNLKEKIPLLDPSKDFQCKTNKYTIEDKNREEVIEILANEMYDCSKQFGFGKVDFLSDDDLILNGREGNICFICSIISYDKTTSNNIRAIPMGDFEKYLNSESPPINKETYAEIFMQVDNARIQFDPRGKSKDTIIVNEEIPTYIAFSAQKINDDGFFEGLKKGSVKIGSGTGIGGLIGGGAGATVGAILSTPAYLGTPVAGAPTTIFLVGTGAKVGATVGATIGSFVGLLVHSSETKDYYSGVLLMSAQEILQSCEDLSPLTISNEDPDKNSKNRK